MYDIDNISYELPCTKKKQEKVKIAKIAKSRNQLISTYFQSSSSDTIVTDNLSSFDIGSNDKTIEIDDIKLSN